MMNMMHPRNTQKQQNPCFLILSGDGINCERETKLALEMAQAQADIVHINDLLKNKKSLKTYQGMIIPGGFSFGDELGSGQILALKISQGLSEEFQEFVADHKPILGICNGFQVLVKLGLLSTQPKQVALAANEKGLFIDRWVGLEVVPESVCLWTKFLRGKSLQLPIRHGEGRVIFSYSASTSSLEEFMAQGQVPLRYSEDVNGSQGRVAGLCDPSGLIFGLMPHPEIAIPPYRRNQERERGLNLFESIVHYFK